ncbi:uncharacterized protein LOC134845835 isoform X2 [Symsagittifera roscoffensis]|uniref:uncharacterized protein LOC134845835 isoform X2 n=1 Tax=Symsagittifera roscoffensis TaxID=84072 RepID=UPI00307B637F
MVIDTGITTEQLQEHRAKIAEFHKKHVDQIKHEKSDNSPSSSSTSAVGGSMNKQVKQVNNFGGCGDQKTNNVEIVNRSLTSVQISQLTSETVTTKVPLKGTMANGDPNQRSSQVTGEQKSQTLPRSNQHNKSSSDQNSKPDQLPTSFMIFQSNQSQTGTTKRKPPTNQNPHTTSTPVIYFQAANSTTGPQKLTSDKDRNNLSDSFGSGSNVHIWTESSSGYASDNLTEEDRSSLNSGSLSRSSSVMDPGVSGVRTWTSPGSGSAEGKGIVSHKGTIRGVQNKVRTALIAFNYEPDIETKAKIRSDQGKNSTLVFPDEEGRVVLYTTSNGIIPEVGNRCLAVRKILMNHRVKFEERDLFLSKENVSEFEMRMKACGGGGTGTGTGTGGSVSNNSLSLPSVGGGSQLDVPQVFIDGVWLGNAKKIEELNESGELKKSLKRFEKISTGNNVCNECWGYCYILCRQCNGSKKSSSVRNGFTDMFNCLKCTQCDPNGLQKCPAKCFKN